MTTHIILLTETWVKSESQAMQLKLPNFTHYYNYRTDIRGGGVSAYIHNDLKHSLSESSYIDGNNYLWIKLQQYAIEIGVVYNPGNTNFQNFLETYNLHLQKKKRTIIFGDFNVDLIMKDAKTKQYKNMIRETGYTILNKVCKKYCTRDSSTRKSILDHVCTNLRKDYFHMALVESTMSDHKQIYLQLKKIKPPPKVRYKYDAIDYTKLYTTVEKSKLIINRDSHYIKLEDDIKNLINNCKTTRIKILNQPQEDWISKNIIDGISRRNYLWIELKKDPTNEKLKEDYQIEKDHVTKLIQNTKDNYYYNKFMQCSQKPKKMWNLINNLATNKIKQSCIPSKLINGTQEITNVKDICEEFNRYFSTIGPILAMKIPKLFHVNNVQALPCSKYNSIFSTFEPCSYDEIIKIINKLDPNSSIGLDGINTKAIKCISPLITENLKNCFNKLLQRGEFPDSLKVAKVTPIYKTGAKTDPGNYRPISVLPILSKILEKILHKRLENYLNSINFLSERQYGFRSKSNTLTATIDLVTKIKTNIDKKHIVLGIYIDLKKAFDTVSHSLLLKKLEHIGIRGPALDMFQSYLTNRFQVVKMENTKSNPLPIHCGIPQGSILGPLLFLVYINNIHELGLHGHVTLYADDTCLFYFGSSIHEIISKAQKDLDTLFKWFQYNLLTINTCKSCYVIFKPKNKKIPTFDTLKINNEILQEKSCEKYLGLRMDSSLTWNAQIEHVKTKLTSLIGSLRLIVRCIPRQIRYTIYNTLVKPHLLYLLEVWGSAAKTKIATLQVMQNKIIKVLFNYHFLTPTSKLYTETKLMNVKQLYTYNTCILIRKILNNSFHTNLTFTKVKQTTSRSTRRASFIVTPKIRTNYGKKTISYEGARLYNKLPSSLKNITSHNQFKKQLAQYITDHF